MQPAPLNMPLNVSGWQRQRGLETARELGAGAAQNGSAAGNFHSSPFSGWMFLPGIFPPPSRSVPRFYLCFGFQSLVSLRLRRRHPRALRECDERFVFRGFFVSQPLSLRPGSRSPPSSPSRRLPLQPRSCWSRLPVSELRALRASVFAQRPPSANQWPASPAPHARAHWRAWPSSRRVTRPAGRGGAGRARGAGAGGRGECECERARSPAGPGAGWGRGRGKFPVPSHSEFSHHSFGTALLVLIITDNIRRR
ncbi:uncharacterized protein LOC129406491 [Sorex araneus]|uniref:uncharacterized protein LOC129406491 n=1 Tax=Sorex araneus TaxID=42254 RepID=UPI0024337C9F|nr:uncharacterized protein LOC129406491 [Sorex araneus]